MRKPSITTRLALGFALVALVVFSLIGGGLYAALQRDLLRQQDDVLNTAANDVQYSLSHIGSTGHWARLRAKLDTLTSSDSSLSFWVISPDPRFAYGAAPPPEAAMRPGYGHLPRPDREYPMRTLTREIGPIEERPRVKLIVGLESAPYFHTLHTFLSALAGLLLLSVLLIALLSRWLTRTGLRPLLRLSDQAQQLSPRNLSQRLHTESLPIELADLALAFNGALNRLESAYKQLEAFNADVAHELRTPLTNLIGHTQVALSRRRGAGELEEVLQSNLEDLDQLRAIVNDMLFLARADQGEAASGLVRTVLAAEVGKTIEFFEFVLDDLGLAIEIDGDIAAQASINTAQFRRAMTNLLQNAIQHTQGAARIDVHIRQAGDLVQIHVSNPGKAIEPRHLPRLFDRFYRVDSARRDSGETHGHGLGLAIVKAVANMHGGGVFARSEAGVTTIGFSVRA
ncbi:MAG TPA: heavy metal sensor histidine kinase [Bordetella sp.]